MTTYTVTIKGRKGGTRYVSFRAGSLQAAINKSKTLDINQDEYIFDIRKR